MWSRAILALPLILWISGCADDGAGPGKQKDPGKGDALLICGGLAGMVCPAGYECVDDPTDTCDPEQGGADCLGQCRPEPPPACAGKMGLPCPDDDQVCIDDPGDECDPDNGGADCIGICVTACEAITSSIECEAASQCDYFPGPCLMYCQPSDPGCCEPGQCLAKSETAECPRPQGSTELAMVIPELPRECSLPLYLPFNEFQLIESKAEFHDLFDCMSPSIAPGIDFAEHRLALVNVRQNPHPSLLWLAEGSEITIGVKVPAYCGGAAPPDTLLMVLVPANGLPVTPELCRVGECPPCPPICPP
jgi:hypothetical protein